MNTTRSLEQRKRFSLLMTIGALLFIAALVYIRLQESRPWPTGPRHLIILLIPALVYLVFRYARTGFVVALFALSLLVLSPEIVWPQYEVPDPFQFLLPVVAYLVCRYARTDIVVLIVSCSFWSNSCPNGWDRRDPKNCPVCPPPEWSSCTASGASAPR